MAQATPTRTRYYPSIRTVTGWTILFMVLLRLAIGWHFFYEGIYKIRSDGAFSSTPYLMASVGPFKDVFHWMVDDMNGTKKRMTQDYLYSKLNERYETIIKFYELTEPQAKSLQAFVERKKHGVPDDNTVEKLFADETLFQRQIVNAGEYVDPKAPGDTNQITKVLVSARPEKREDIIKRIKAITDDLDAMVLKGVEDEMYRKDAKPEQPETRNKPVPGVVIVPAGAAADDVSWITRGYVEKVVCDRYDLLKKHYQLTEAVQHQSKYGWRYRDQKLRGHHDKNNVDYILNDPDFQKALDDYKALLDQIEAEEKEQQTQYDDERLTFNTSKRNSLRNKLLARVEAPLGDVDLSKIQGFSEYIGPIKDITPAQLSKGPLPAARELTFPGSLLKQIGVGLPKSTLTYWQDIGMMLGLTVIGVCLILGLFTRLAAIGGAVMLAMFYLAMPPFPGAHVPENAAEGHYLFVNKNLIEMIALLMIATSGVGRWLGLDAFIHAIFGRREQEVVEASAPASEVGSGQGAVYIPGTRTGARDGGRV